MQIQKMFAKPINRDIQGVIIVGQAEKENVQQELEEYVVTDELQKHFADFYKAYDKGIDGNTAKMGVWISGFFGSGKSHFLKILSYLLANKEVGGKHAIDYFTDDRKIKDASVLAAMKKAAAVPSDVVLFNIDSKSDANSKSHKDAIVNVFLKVFNEMQGFCNTLPKLADMERKLTEEGRYQEFKDEFEKVNGNDWEAERDDFDFIADDIVEVLTSMGWLSEEAARNFCEAAIQPYSISIEDFAKRVKKYLDAKEDNYHIIFLVDEVGQYVGEDRNLMLDLQTLTEELGKECKGKAWIVVTSQQDIDKITRVKGNDFSKIQGRFDTRLALSSANVDAVIKKRILEKTDKAAADLKALYAKKNTIIKNLIVFNDSVEKKLYDNENNFAEVYPFITYQFNLLSSVLTAIREHGAAGKHLAGGERSMLAMFKESAVNYMHENAGCLIPFHSFYDAMENFLDHSHRSVIIRAYQTDCINPEGKQQGQDVFNINVLKTLFLIKYVNNITATLENITSLMVSNINDDRLKLKDEVANALKVLISQNLIQQNGDIYIFLSNEEQEINRKINSEPVEMTEVINNIAEVIFDDIYESNKYKYPALNGRYSFSFNQKIDDRPVKSGQNYKIGVHILTPAYEGALDEQSLNMKSMSVDEVLVVLPNTLDFMEEMRTYLKIAAYLRKNTVVESANAEAIRQVKSREMSDRLKNTKMYLEEALKASDLYVRGSKFSTSSKDIDSRINDALKNLTEFVYNKLGYIDTAVDSAAVLKVLKNESQITLLDSGEEINQNAKREVLSYITLNSSDYGKISMKGIKTNFMDAPYGYVDDDIHWLVAVLFKKGDIAFEVNGTNITQNNKTVDELYSYITNKKYVEKLLISKRDKVSDKEKKVVKDVLKDLFRYTVSSDDEDVLMTKFRDSARDMIAEMVGLLNRYENKYYPGKAIVETGKNLLNGIMTETIPAEFYKKVWKKQDELFDLAEDYKPVKDFFNSDQKKYFDEARKLVDIYNRSKTYIKDDALIQLHDDMQDILEKPEPYSDIPKLPKLIEDFSDKYTEFLEEKYKPIHDSIVNCRDRVLKELTGKSFEKEFKDKYYQAFEDLDDQAKKANDIVTLLSYRDQAEYLMNQFLDNISQEEARRAAEPKQPEPGSTTPHIINDPPPKKPYKVTVNTSIKALTGLNSWRIESEEDVDKYIDALRDKLKKKISKDKILRVNF